MLTKDITVEQIPTCLGLAHVGPERFNFFLELLNNVQVDVTFSLEISFKPLKF
jgi:hypothetical protein